MVAPQYQPPKPLPGRDIAVCTGIALVLASLLLPVFRTASATARSEACSSYLKNRSMAVLMYATDYDNHLPPATQWQQHLRPYASRETLTCLELGLPRSQELGFGMDSRLSGRALERLEEETKNRIVLFETSLLKPSAHDPGVSFAARHPVSYSSLPRGWVGFLDGHLACLSLSEGKAATQRGTLPARN